MSDSLMEKNRQVDCSKVSFCIPQVLHKRGEIIESCSRLRGSRLVWLSHPIGHEDPLQLLDLIVKPNLFGLSCHSR